MSQKFSSQLLQELANQVPMKQLDWPTTEQCGITVTVRRDDLIHPLLSGNKFYKLFLNLFEARKQGLDTILSFGGAYSNHIHALAAAGKEYGINTIGVIRGEQATELSPTLKDARDWGMTLKFVDRQTYRLKTDPTVLADLSNEFGDFYVVPEGGGNLLGAQGCQLITQATIQALDGEFDAICVACGTGSTLAGIVSALPTGKKAYGFSVLKGAGKLESEIGDLITQLNPSPSPSPSQTTKNWQLISGYHGGGYAKLKPELIKLIQRFEAMAGFQLDPVYTAKLFWGIEQEALKDRWPRGTRLVVVHSGGLQGRRGYPALSN